MSAVGLLQLVQNERRDERFSDVDSSVASSLHMLGRLELFLVNHSYLGRTFEATNNGQAVCVHATCM